MSGVDELLGALGSEGVLDSEGTFTVHLEKAREKLRQYRLPTPHHYILSIVSSAVLGGADTLRVEKSGGTCTVSFNSRPYGVDEVKALFETMLLGGATADPRLVEFGLAIQGARGLRPLFLEVESGSHTEGMRLSLQGDTLQLQPLEALPNHLRSRSVSTEFHIREKNSSVFDLIRVGLGVPRADEELRLIKRRARYAPCEIFMAQEKLNNTRLGPWLFSARIDGFPMTYPMKVSSPRVYPLQGDGTMGGYIGFGEGRGGWILVHRGLTFQLPASATYPNSRAVIYVEKLERDLSGGGLVQNEAFNRVVAGVEELLTRLMQRAISEAHALSAEAKELLRSIG